MKVILSESQYKSMVKLISDLETKAKFIRGDLKTTIERDIQNNLSSRYEGRLGSYGLNPGESLFITPEPLSSALSKYNKQPKLIVGIYVDNNKAMVFIHWNTSIIDYTGDPQMNRVEWRYIQNEDGYDEFFNKVYKVIDRRLSKKNQDRIIKNFEETI
jgi:hypothetical protein